MGRAELDSDSLGARTVLTSELFSNEVFKIEVLLVKPLLLIIEGEDTVLSDSDNILLVEINGVSNDVLVHKVASLGKVGVLNVCPAHKVSDSTG